MCDCRGAETVSAVSRREILSVFCGTCLARIATIEVFNFLIEPTSVLNAAEYCLTVTDIRGKKIPACRYTH
jgi:hypothetical protein